jgi:hypothetical protein
MPYSQELASLITIRNFLMSADENVQCKLSKEESNGLRTKVSEIDRAIVDRAMKFDPSEAKAVSKVKLQTFSTSVDVEDLMKAVDSIKPDDEEPLPQIEQPVSGKVKHKIVKHGV